MTITIEECTFTNGISEQGGAIYLSGLSSLYLSKSSFSKNYAKYSGGAIYASSFKDFNVVDTVFDSNYASERGSEIYGIFSTYKTKLSNV